jgi:hypothetical protein
MWCQVRPVLGHHVPPLPRATRPDPRDRSRGLDGHPVVAGCGKPGIDRCRMSTVTRTWAQTRRSGSGRNREPPTAFAVSVKRQSLHGTGCRASTSKSVAQFPLLRNEAAHRSCVASCSARAQRVRHVRVACSSLDHASVICRSGLMVTHEDRLHLACLPGEAAHDLVGRCHVGLRQRTQRVDAAVDRGADREASAAAGSLAAQMGETGPARPLTHFPWTYQVRGATLE